MRNPADRMAAVALGYYPDAAAAAAVGNALGETLAPDCGKKDLYDKGFARYQKIWQLCRPIFNEA